MTIPFCQVSRPRRPQSSTSRRAVCSAAAITALVVGTVMAEAQTASLGTPIPTMVPNGPVTALALDADVLYVGGSFDQVNLPTGTFASVDAATGTAVTGKSGLASRVMATAADGAGGWLVATVVGFFENARAELVHVSAAGSLDAAWTPPDFGAPSVIFTLRLDGGRLYVGGNFTTVNGLPRAGIAAVDPVSGAVLPWTADLAIQGAAARPAVTGLAVSPGRLYMSGLFTHVGSDVRHGFAVLDAATGQALPPTLQNAAGFAGTPVVAGTRVYVNANCHMGLSALCAYDLDLVPLPGWTFPFSNVFLGPFAASDTAVFATYRSFDFPFNERTVRLDPATGVEVAWPAVSTTGGVDVLAVSDGRLYLGGRFSSVNSQERSHLAAVEASSGALDSWAPLVGGAVTAVSVQGNRVGFGGEFRGAGGTRKRNLVALDLRTGQVATPNVPDLPFSPTAFLKIGTAMVVAGGDASLVPSQPSLLAFSTNTGALLPWSVTTDGAVTSLATDGQRLYFGGGFSRVGTVARNRLAAVDLRTGTISNWHAQAQEPVTAIAVANGALYAGGGFPGYPGGGGESRNFVAAFDLGSGSTLPFRPRPAMFHTSGFAFHQDRVLLVGSGDALEWVDRTSGAPVPPATPGNGHVSGVAHVGDTIFAVGLKIDATGALAVIDAPSGRLQVFDVPSAGALAANDTYLAMAGSSLTVIRRPGPGAPERLTASVVGATVTLGWQAGPPPATSAFIVEVGTTPGASDIGSFPAGALTRVSGVLSSGTYFARVRGVGASGTGGPSSEAIITVPSTATPPSAPGPLSASVAGGVVSLTWGAASGNATTYVIEVGTASGLSDIGSLVTGHLDTRLVAAAPPGTYFVRVRAANARGLGPATSEVRLVVP